VSKVQPFLFGVLRGQVASLTIARMPALAERLPEPPPSPRWTRRRLFQGLAIGGAVTTVGGGGLAYAALHRGTPGAGLRILTEAERTTVAAVAEVYFPATDGMPAPDEVGAIDFVDRFVAEMPPNLSRLIQLAIRTLEWAAIFHGSERARFSKASLATRTAMLDAWDGSTSEIRRGAVFSLKWSLGMGYFEHPHVRQAMGWNAPCSFPSTGTGQEWL